MRILILIALLTTGCSQIPVGDRLISVTYQVGIKCPDGHYYRFSDSLCYPSSVKAANKAIVKHVARATRTKAIKPLRMAKIDCSKVFKAINQCSVVNK